LEKENKMEKCSIGSDAGNWNSKRSIHAVEYNQGRSIDAVECNLGKSVIFIF
jgi:hypothetical protein